MNSDSPSKYV
jgi:hypothetical protein